MVGLSGSHAAVQQGCTAARVRFCRLHALVVALRLLTGLVGVQMGFGLEILQFR